MEDGNERAGRKGEGCGDHDKPLGKDSGYHRNKNQSNLFS